MSLVERIRQHFSESIQTKIIAADSLSPAIAKAAQMMAERLINGHRIYTCGNGSSASDAQRFSAQMLNHFEVERPPLPAIALSTDSSTLTAIGDDHDLSQIFSKQIDALAQPGDILLVISTSGDSANLVKAVESAHNRGAHVIALTGKEGGKVSKVLSSNDIEIRIPSDHSPRIQECQVLTLHCLCDLIDYQIFATPSESLQ